jgi:predicted amidohydrolase YtcJ
VRGLREAHAHIAAHGREMSQLNLADCVSRRECLERIAAESSRLDAAREHGWMVANGMRVEGWTDAPGAWPTMVELDRLSPGRPCMVQSFDHHACAVNGLAFAAAGFARTSSDPEGGRIVRGMQGDPTGVLLEAAYGRARRAVPEPTREEWKKFVGAGLRDLAELGFVEVHDLLSPAWLGAMLAEMESDGELPVSVWLYPTLDDVETVAADRKRWERQRVRLAGAKVFADGTLNGRTAWMLHPYADALPGLPYGEAMVTFQELGSAMALTERLGVGLAVHAIGDAAVRAVLDAYQDRDRAGREGEFPRLRIEHAELIDAADAPRFAELGVVCSVQPCHLLYDVEALRRGQPARLDRVLPLRELIDSGCRPGELLWFGSDVPIVRPHAQDSIQAAVARRRAEMPATDAIASRQAITETEAWAAFGV